MKQLGLVLVPLALSMLFGLVAWLLTETAWITTLATTLPIALLRPILNKVRAINQAEYQAKQRRRHSPSEPGDTPAK